MREITVFSGHGTIYFKKDATDAHISSFDV